jgi:hypothetical protein
MVMMPDKDKVNFPDWTSRAYDDMLLDVTLCRDLTGGTRSVRGKEEAYLPKHPAEDAASYGTRLQESIFFNAFARTIKGLAGMVFRTDLQADEDVPDPITDLFENIDNRGSHFDVFARSIFEDALEVGHSIILVDFPKVENAQALTMADEQQMQLRPFWVHVRKEQVLSWRWTQTNGSLILTQVVIEEVVRDPDGRFGEKERTQYRVLTLEPGGVFVEVLAINDKKVVVTLEPKTLVSNVDAIPMVVVYGSRKTGELLSDPPLLDLAYTNITHYQVQSNHLYSLKLGSVPILVALGVSNEESIEVGPNVMVKLPDTNQDLKYVEHSGPALDATRQQLQDLKGELAVLGLSMLMSEKRAAETAEAKRIDKAEQDSALAVAARSLQDGLEMALAFTAQFMKLETGGSITVPRDFAELVLSPEEMNAYSLMVEKGQLSLDTLWQVMQDNGRLPDNFDPEVEEQAVADEAMRFMPPEPEVPPVDEAA